MIYPVYGMNIPPQWYGVPVRIAVILHRTKIQIQTLI